MQRLSAMTLRCLPVILAAMFAAPAAAQTPPVEGLRDNTPRVHALVNARIVRGPGRVIEKGNIVLRNGTIQAVGARVAIPHDARVWDYDGMTVYPGLIELYSHIGLKKTERKPEGASRGDEPAAEGAPYWNAGVTPERDVLDAFDPSGDDRKKLRALGFACALIVPRDGVIGGAGALVSLGDGDVNGRVIQRRAAQSINLAHARRSFRDVRYPTSLMGRIALIRQALLDARWYGAAQRAYAANPAQQRPEVNDALAALYDDVRGRRPMLFSVSDDFNLLRARKIAREFDLTAWVRGSGHEYRAIDALKEWGAKLIVPVDYPEAPDVESPETALDVPLYELQHWEMAPSNGAALERAGIPFAYTTAGLKKLKTFRAHVREAIERGLSEKTALAALTTVPARMLGLERVMGTIDRGKIAHLVVADGDLFAGKTKVAAVWVDGRVYEVDPRPEVDPRGQWNLSFEGTGLAGALTLEITGEIGKLIGTLRRDSTEITLKGVGLDVRRLSLSFSAGELGVDGVVRLTGAVKKNVLEGQGELPGGEWFHWRATPTPGESGGGAAESKEPRSKKNPAAVTWERGFGAYGAAGVPVQPKHVLVRNATIWTSGPQGRLDRADMLVTRGRITRIGRGLGAPSGALVVDAAGKHVTPGLIDAHSHSGITDGVNEVGQAVTAEVRIADVLNPRSIAFYRELAGGLTAANILHGSANPIGGQNAVVKLRWGAAPDELLVEDAIGGIKFALGENVKQSNWGERFTSRYPQTRMGVEQIIRDRFKAALDYEAEWKQYNQRKKKKNIVPPRRDLELEALLEVLHGTRLVHSHSYRQDEILMLIRIADDFGFRIATFQHVLEGYKVADALAAHGAGASTFSDWWAYKFEVYDAIPYNGTLMHDVGVVVSFNSDSSELARRLNLEAAKAVKYGGLSEEEALKFVTLNPAKQLRIDHRVGSLEAGKDADFVVWSGDPLSAYSRCEQTWIEGRKYFDIGDDLEMRGAIAAERARLIQKVLAETAGSKAGKKGKAESGTD